MKVIVRSSLTGLPLLGMGIAVWSQVALKSIERNPVRIDSLVSGTYPPSGIKAYFGVPFAAPPIRELRWKAPEPVKAWTGALTASRMQAKCPRSLRDSNINHYFGEEAVRRAP